MSLSLEDLDAPGLSLGSPFAVSEMGAEATSEPVRRGRTTRPGRAFRTVREARGWSLNDLARLADCDPDYLSQVERDETTPTRWFTAHIAATLALGADQPRALTA